MLFILIARINTGYSIQIQNYSRGSNSERSNTESIQKRNISKFWFRMVLFWNGQGLAIDIYGTDHSKSELFKMATLA